MVEGAADVGRGVESVEEAAVAVGVGLREDIVEVAIGLVIVEAEEEGDLGRRHGANVGDGAAEVNAAPGPDRFRLSRVNRA